MSGAVHKYGRPVSGPEVDYAYIGPGDQRACVYDATGVNDLIVYGLAGWLGKHSGSPLARLGIAYVAGAGAGYPGGLIAYTSEMSITNTYLDNTDGQQYRQSITPFHLPASSKFSLVLTSRNGNTAHSMRQASAIVATNENFYYTDLGTGNVPTNPVGGSGSNQGHASLWFEAEVNVAPNPPTNLLRNSVNSLTPTFYSTFSDVNQILGDGQAYDKLTQLQIRVWQGGSLLWDTGIVNASAPETANNQTARSYGGPNLLYNTTYLYEVRHRDILGAWSNWSGTNFTIDPTNTAPYNPTGLLPSGAQTSTDLTPNMVSNFDDADEVLSTGQAWDYLNRYQMKVTRVSDGVVMLPVTTYIASPSEQANDQTFREYSGGALAYNTNYLYEVRHEDRMGAWSNWSSTTFSITSASTVETPLTPAGFVTNIADPGNITAVYRHSAGLSANAIQARLLASNGSPVFTAPAKTVAVAANGTLSMTWVESGFAPYINLGTDYRIEVIARDTNNVWASSWSPAQTIAINAAPLTPAGMLPSDNKVGSQRPLVTVEASDPNPETPVQVILGVKPVGGAEVEVNMVRVGQTNTYQFQVTAAQMPGYGTFELRAVSYDGHLWSSWSPVHDYIYAAGPTVALTAPTSPVGTSQPTFAWTTTGQVKYRLLAYHPVSGALVYDTGDVTSSAGSAVVAPGNWVGSEVWNTGETFNWVVRVQDGSTLWGESAALPIQLFYTPPPSLPITVTPEIQGVGSQPTAQRLSWAMSAVSSEFFQGYELWRSELLADGATVRAGTTILLADIPAITTTNLLDAEITSKQGYRWDVLQRITVGADTLRSAVTSVSATLQWDGVMLHCPAAPLDLAVHLMYGADDKSTTETQLSQPSKLVTPYGGGNRLAFFGPGQSNDPSGSFGLIPDGAGSADEKLDALLTLYSAQNGGWDGAPKSICWRDGTGGKLGRVYGILDDPTITNAGAKGYKADLKLHMATFNLGVQS